MTTYLSTATLLCTVLIASFTHRVSVGQERVLDGFVFNSANNPIVDISVEVEQVGQQRLVTKTDGKGYYKLNLPSEKPYQLAFVDSENNNYDPILIGQLLAMRSRISVLMYRENEQRPEVAEAATEVARRFLRERLRKILPRPRRDSERSRN